MRGALCISIDMELAWGTWDKPHAEFHDRCAEHEAAIVSGMLDAFGRHDVSATWAIVGRLLERDPAATPRGRHGDAIWYAPQLVERVRESRVPQDIGSHSYSHIYFGESSREAIRADLQAARRVHDHHGLPFVSFVFPRNQIAHIDLLQEVGVKVYRSVDRGWHITARDHGGRLVGRVAHLTDSMLPIAPTTVRPIRHGTLVELPSSMLLMARNGLRRVIRPWTVIAKARRALQDASRTGGVFHLWFHPSNFYYRLEQQLETLEQILAIASAMRARNELDIVPMSAFAA